MRQLALLGSTGSIGRQTLEVAAASGYAVSALAARQNVRLLEEQARAFRPRIAAVYEEEAARELRRRLRDTDVRVFSGMDGLLTAAALPENDLVLTAVVGMIGLRPTLAAIEAGHDIALANKETLVCAGHLVMKRAREKGVRILPVDSEHSAIFQCLRAADGNEVSRLILTASGGPFYGKSRREMAGVTAEQALRHPNWSMGAKITVDSATMMNKGLELIEAMWLYNQPPERIEIVVHRESVVHSLIEFADHSVLAQLGAPDMRLPIQYALTFPARLPGAAPRLDLTQWGQLHFDRPDPENFPALTLARQAARQKGNRGAVLNGANEAAVALFLAGKIGFLDIARLTELALTSIPAAPADRLEDILLADERAKQRVYQEIG